MEKIIWNDNFSVHHSRLDWQHKKIIQLINQMTDRHNENVDSVFVSELLNAVREYSDLHLAFEEDLLVGEPQDLLGFLQAQLEIRSHQIRKAARIVNARGNRKDFGRQVLQREQFFHATANCAHERF